MKTVLTCSMFIFSFLSIFSQNLDYKNPSLSFEERAEILVQQMTLDEKISQMTDVAAAIPRLDIPAYNWWNEGLHGVARAGIATVFPQAIGLAATFDDSLMFKIATIISNEFRAKYNDAISKGNRARYYGLTVWSPNINIFRDPRWGRGQETYGEDPYLTSRMGVMFVKGLQGDHPKYFKTIATPKHYVVHSGPEKLRHVFDVDVSEYDFLDTYTPAFKACVEEGKAFSVMGAYNRFRGKSCSASDTLLNTLLRKKWGFQGYVVSDCDAIADIYQTHKIVATPEEAAALGVRNGCDLNCGDTYKYLKKAVEQKLITEEEINRAVKRLMIARLRLGMFDPKGSCPYDTLTLASVDNTQNRAMALLAAQKSIVLLKNDNKTLPLNRKLIKKIAVVGPNANNPMVMFGNYNGFPSYSYTPYQGISKTVFQKTSVYYHPLNGWVSSEPEYLPVPSSLFEFDGKKGLKVDVFNNTQLKGEPIYSGVDTTIMYSWYATPPYPNVPANNVSVRWTGKIVPPADGTYSFAFTGDDGYRIWVDGKIVAEQWKDQAPYTSTFQLKLQKDRKQDIVIEYYQSLHGAVAEFKWNQYSEKDIDEAIKKAGECDVIVYVGGLSPTLEGEEMPVNLTGFDGGDRTQIELPAIQTQMLKRLKKTGKPVILVLMAGSALSINWENENLDAIVMAWYPGQEGGTAIASVLFGDYNPGGRLPVTFYASTNQLPSFDNYSMKNRTYRYFTGKPLYPFGYGLSYTNFTYSDLKIPSTSDTKEKIKVTVTVQNAGGRAGDEVVQLYVKHPTANIPVPIHALKGFKRVFLKAGDKKTVTFELEAKDLAILDKQNRWFVKPGDIDIFVGGQQPNPKLIKEGKILSGTITLTGDNFYLE
ncbi:MAG: glycoside hydrolase family 3 C-terminal domain-containing protein [Bacteroidales bacterium]|nr:glycoside hydrolase family 3 C-terminal domain-containing protein [Bacteroidales bacterium]